MSNTKERIFIIYANADLSQKPTTFLTIVEKFGETEIEFLGNDYEALKMIARFFIIFARCKNFAHAQKMVKNKRLEGAKESYYG